MITTFRILASVALVLSIDNALWSRPAHAASVQVPKTEEIIFNTGVGPASATDPQTFATSTDGAFIGVLEGISVQFVDEQQQWLFTTCTFRIVEWLVPNKSGDTGERIDVLTLGGTFVETAGRRVAKKPAEIAASLQIGVEYFVPIKRERRPGTAWTGKNLLAGIDAFTRLQPDDVSPVYRHSKWLTGILAHAPNVQSLPGAGPNRRALFVATIRGAAVAKR